MEMESWKSSLNQQPSEAGQRQEAEQEAKA
jgi:hypothetical protein